MKNIIVGILVSMVIVFIGTVIAANLTSHPVIFVVGAVTGIASTFVQVFADRY